MILNINWLKTRKPRQVEIEIDKNGDGFSSLKYQFNVFIQMGYEKKQREAGELRQTLVWEGTVLFDTLKPHLIPKGF